MARYHFVTEFSLPAPPDRVWDVLADPTTWPVWWRWLQRVDVLAEPGPDRLKGARYRTAFGTALPYTLSFDLLVTAADRPRALDSVASGELQGSGHWRLQEASAGGTNVRYGWLVETTKRWMNLLAPVARPAFSWNHDILMRDFVAGVGVQTGTAIRAVRNTTVKPGAPGFYRPPDRPAG